MTYSEAKDLLRDNVTATSSSISSVLGIEWEDDFNSLQRNALRRKFNGLKSAAASAAQNS